MSDTLTRYDGPVTFVMNLPPLNVGLLTDLLTWAAQDEADLNHLFEGWGEWAQDIWAKEIRNGACQTSYCLFGQAVVQKGYVLDMHKDYPMAGGVRWSAENCGPPVESGTFDNKGKPIMVPDPEHMEPIGDVAERVLGLTTEEGALSNGNNSLYELVSLGSYFARRRGVELPLLPEVAKYDRRIGDQQFENFCETEDFDISDSDPDW